MIKNWTHSGDPNSTQTRFMGKSTLMPALELKEKPLEGDRIKFGVGITPEEAKQSYKEIPIVFYE